MDTSGSVHRRASVIIGHIQPAQATTEVIPQHASGLFPHGLLHDQVAIITGSGTILVRVKT